MQSARAKGKEREVEADGLTAQDEVITFDEERQRPVKRQRMSKLAEKVTAPPSVPAKLLAADKSSMLPRKFLSKAAYKATLPDTAGSKWFHMPAAPKEPSIELKREVAALKLSGAIDSKRFLRGEAKRSSGKLPEYFQVS